MDISRNPFAELACPKEVSAADTSEDAESIESSKLIERIFLITRDRDLLLGTVGRPPCMFYLDSSPTDRPILNADLLDQILFDRLQIQEIPQTDLILLKPDTSIADMEEAAVTEPVTYLFSCFKRASFIKNQSNLSAPTVKSCEDAITRQLLLLLMIDLELEQTQHVNSLYQLLYDTVSSNDADAIVTTEALFLRTMNQLEQDTMTDVSPTALCPESTLRVVRPLIDRLNAGLRALNPSLESSSLFANFLSSRQLVGAKERALFCPQRKPLMHLARWFSRSFCTAQLLIEASYPPNMNSPQLRGQEFEAGVLGRILVPSHLHTAQPPEMVFLANRTNSTDVGEFFTDEVPLKHVVESEQRTIWQLTDQMDEDLHSLMLNFLRVGKQHVALRTQFFQWLGACIRANKARGQLASTMNSGLLAGPDSKGLATDGFLSNLTAVIVRLTGPLINPTPEGPPLDKLWPAYASRTSTESNPLLPDLSKETRLAATLHTHGSSSITLPSEIPVLTELFFLAHAAIRVGWTPLISRHFETAQYLHQLEAQWQAHEASGLTANADPQVQFLRRLIRERTSRYLEQSTSLSNATRLRNLLAFTVTTSQLLVHLSRSAFGLSSCKQADHGTLSDLPEFLVDNIVELVSYLRRAKDDFLEAAEIEHIPLEPLLEFSILFMLHTRALANPHLRARLAEVLESLIPLRDDEAWNNQQASGLLGVHNLSFLRRQRLFIPDSGSTRPEILQHAVAALLTAFVSIELSPGIGAVGSAGSAAEVLIASASSNSSTPAESSENQSDAPSAAPGDASGAQSTDPHTATVGFEEKFQYRRPMYACLRFWHGTPFYDQQFQQLESEALQRLEDVTPPLFLQFLSLLVNDAIFLLDEAISLLAQLKNKEREREAAGGRLANQQDESLFAHTGRLARHHIMLGLDTIAALRRVVSICPRLITHPILVDRIACMLNYFLTRLVGPKQRDLTVRDKAAYGFRPDLLVIEICQIYNSLALESDVADTSAVQAFRRAVVSDERSFTPDLLDLADQVLHRVAAPPKLCETFAQTMTLIKSENVIKMEDDIDVDDAPDEFVDPIMGHVMEDPVKLPTSGHVVDRKTIYRHLLNDSTDPFNRQPLAMAQVQPQLELRAAIQAWIAERRALRANSNAPTTTSTTNPSS